MRRPWGNDELYGGDGYDILLGGVGSDYLWGDAGDDRLAGQSNSDFLTGGSGNDWLNGGHGQNFMYGGTGADEFAFSHDWESNGDLILDFNRSDFDFINLSAIDAIDDTVRTGKQAFVFIGTDGFNVVGQLRYHNYYNSGGLTYIEGNTEGGTAAEFIITVQGIVAFSTSDFIL